MRRIKVSKCHDVWMFGCFDVFHRIVVFLKQISPESCSADLLCTFAKELDEED